MRVLITKNAKLKIVNISTNKVYYIDRQFCSKGWAALILKFLKCHGFELTRLKLYRNDLKGSKSYLEFIAGGSSY